MEHLEKNSIDFEKADENTVNAFAEGDYHKRQGALRILRYYRPHDFEYLDKTKTENLSPGLAGCLERYMGQVALKGISGRSLIITRSYLRRFLEYLETNGVTEIQSVTRETVSDYAMYIFLYRFTRKPVFDKDAEPRAYTASTRMQILVHIRNFFKYLKKRGEVYQNPAEEVQLPKLPQSLSREVPATKEVDKLLSTIDKSRMAGLRNYAMLETLYSAGLRSSELIRLKVEDIDFEQKFITVRKGKYGKPRTVPASNAAFSAIKEYLAFSRPALLEKRNRETVRLGFDAGLENEAQLTACLFLDIRYGMNLSTQTVESIIKDCARKAGIKKRFIPHSFRYACATHMMRNGADIRFIQEMLGHESLLTTQVYTKVVKGDLKRMMKEHHPRELDWQEARPQGTKK
jgi:integrase/recombinase XerD